MSYLEIMKKKGFTVIGLGHEIALLQDVLKERLLKFKKN